MSQEKILVIGNFKSGLDQVRAALKKAECQVVCSDWTNLKSLIADNNPDIIIPVLGQNDVQIISGKISEIKQVNDALPIVVVSQNNHCESAVKVMKQGANDFIVLPIQADKFRQAITQHLHLYSITKKVFFLDGQSMSFEPFEEMIGRSEKMQDNFRIIEAVAKSNATVLITGESGTGKELVAKAIHNRSSRKDFRFVDINCGAIPHELLENELFGHEKGAFTGAHKRYQGSFEVANKGTLFLDEISEMDPLLQVKLLRVLQERSFMRIGGTEKIDVDVRIIAATNRNLHESMAKGQFREDLYYRLNVVNVNIPSLRERREDIPLLAGHFLEYYTAKNNRIFVDFADDAMSMMINYDWPGNVRELENTIERIVVLHNDSQVKIKYLPKHLQKLNKEIRLADLQNNIKDDDSRVIPLDDLERNAIELALVKFHGNVAVAAKKLKIGQATLYRKIKRYGLVAQ